MAPPFKRRWSDGRRIDLLEERERVYWSKFFGVDRRTSSLPWTRWAPWPRTCASTSIAGAPITGWSMAGATSGAVARPRGATSTKRRLLGAPGIYATGPAPLQVIDIASDDNQVVMKACSGNEAVDDGQGLSLRFGEPRNEAPARGDFGADGQQAPLESAGEIRADPSFQLGAS